MRFHVAAALPARRVCWLYQPAITKTSELGGKSQAPSAREIPKSQAPNPKQTSSSNLQKAWLRFGFLEVEI